MQEYNQDDLLVYLNKHDVKIFTNSLFNMFPRMKTKEPI